MNEKLNPHQGSAFDDFLKSEGIYEEAMASPKVKRAFKDLADSIEAGQHEAFAAGWNAFLATHSVLLITHGIKDVRVGFERAWTKYGEKRRESNPALLTNRTAKKLSTLPQNRRLRGGPVLLIPGEIAEIQNLNDCGRADIEIERMKAILS